MNTFNYYEYLWNCNTFQTLKIFFSNSVNNENEHYIFVGTLINILNISRSMFVITQSYYLLLHFNSYYFVIILHLKNLKILSVDFGYHNGFQFLGKMCLIST